MWSRRAQEYEAKINSGDLISIAEVVRDLHRADNQPEQSYSERQLYESALDRMAREVAAIEQIDRDAAIGMLTKSLVKQPGPPPPRELSDSSSLRGPERATAPALSSSIRSTQAAARPPSGRIDDPVAVEFCEPASISSHRRRRATIGPASRSQAT